MNDLENEPVRWDAARINAKGWGLPAQESWFFETSALPQAHQRRRWNGAGYDIRSVPRVKAGALAPRGSTNARGD